MLSTLVWDGVIDEQRLSEHEAAYLLGRVKFAANQPAPLMIIDAKLQTAEGSLIISRFRDYFPGLFNK